MNSHEEFDPLADMLSGKETSPSDAVRDAAFAPTRSVLRRRRMMRRARVVVALVGCYLAGVASVGWWQTPTAPKQKVIASLEEDLAIIAASGVQTHVPKTKFERLRTRPIAPGSKPATWTPPCDFTPGQSNLPRPRSSKFHPIKTTLFSPHSKKPDSGRPTMLLTTTIRSVLLGACLLMALSTSRFAYGQEAAEHTEGAIIAPGATPSLTFRAANKEKSGALPDTEGAVQKALENNPDIAVAKAKLQEAEAELRRIQWRVARDVLTLQAGTHAAEFAYMRAKEANEKHGKAVSSLELKRLESEWITRKTELQYLLGYSGSNVGTNFALTDRGTASSKVLPTPGPLEAIRKILDQPTELEFAEMPLSDMVTYLKDQHETEIQIDKVALESVSIGVDTPITFSLRNKPLGAAFEAIEDLYPDLRFVIRDYGIVITADGSPLHGKAASAVKLWRARETRRCSTSRQKRTVRHGGHGRRYGWRDGWHGWRPRHVLVSPIYTAPKKF